ncbi:hypothetical protein CAI21_06755 [Alkalilimnicola ehrlichii]|uniref:Fatty acid desaturase domain-containing protein n=1 Tax=Alkalilimnicola ehrlichii TaxID=351052 RepID=A0A3E0WY23_9GAMM|nr:fatty acid desaturase [Alkalilimnicola ehrlichii]RFA30305.1 hypothetical protein CAI21_06755 [Alkalilimnicola ehrlichii]RFA37882.1 hypothetical protein CAL65_08105 [Alkalilimnicola ehrlichii]
MFFLALAANTFLLIAFPLSLLSAPLVLLQAIMFVGLVEAFHQSVHSNLFPGKRANLVVGVFVGAFLGTSYPAYRRFHLKHHQLTNSDGDPEARFYTKASSRLRALLLIPITVAGHASIVNAAQDLLQRNDVNLHKFTMLLIYLRAVLILLALVLYPSQTLAVFLLPMLVFFYYEYFMSHSQHYQKPYAATAPKGLEHYRYSRNLRLPNWIGFLSLYTNYHATHHASPSAKWYRMPEVAASHGDIALASTVPYLGFVKSWWRHGVRTWPEEVSGTEEG